MKITPETKKSDIGDSEKACTRNKLDLTTVRHATHIHTGAHNGSERAEKKAEPMKK